MADVKNYGLSGVGVDLQFGKKGGHFKWQPNGGLGEGAVASFAATAPDNTTLIPVRGAAGVGANDYVTLSQMQSSATGLIVKPAVVAVVQQGAETTSLGAWTDTNGGTFAGSGPTSSIGGVTGLTGTVRVLVRWVGITLDGNGQPVPTASASQNGIYDLDTATGVYVRSAESNAQDEVNFNNYVFVSSGTDAGDSYVISNLVGATTALQLNSTPITWVLFSDAPVYTANNGVQLANGNFSLNVDSLNLQTTPVATTSTIAIGDGNNGGNDNRTTVANLFNSNNVVYNIPTWVDDATSDGMVVRSGDNEYGISDMLAMTAAGKQGIEVTTDWASAGDIQVGLNINGLTANGTNATTDSVVVFNGTNNVKTTWGALATDLNLVGTGAITSGYLVKTADDTYAGRTITVNTGASAGLSVVNGDAVAGNTVLGLNIDGLTGVAAALTDSIPLFDTTDSSNKKATIQSIVDLVAANVSDSEISQGDSSIAVVDAGTGAINFVVDGGQVATMTAAGGLVATSVTSSNLTVGRVVLAGAGGALVDDAGMTYDSTNNDLTVLGSGTFGSLSTSVGGISSATTIGAGGAITAGGNITTTTGTVTGQAVVGTSSVATGAAGSISAGTGGVTSTDLTIAGGVVYAESGRLKQEAGFAYDSATNTLTVTNLNVTGSGGSSVADTQIAFGIGSGNTGGDADFTYDTATDTVSIGSLDITGKASQTITGTAIDGDINIVPNGAGEVVIGGAGAGVISSDVGQSMTVSGATDLLLEAGSGAVIISDAAGNIAAFNANANADAWLTVTSDTAANGVQLGTNIASDIKFVLGASNLLVVSDATAYNTELAASTNADALVTKSFVTNLVQTGAAQEAIKSVLGTVSLAANGTTSINTASGAPIPAGATITNVKLRVAQADPTATVSIGEANSLSRYQTVNENDPSALGVYESVCFDTDGGTITILVTVANSAGTPSASANVIVEYRVPVV